MAEYGLPANQAWQKLTDIWRLQIHCETPAEVKAVFKKACASPLAFHILRFKPRFNSHLKDMILNFDMFGQCIGES